MLLLVYEKGAGGTAPQLRAGPASEQSAVPVYSLGVRVQLSALGFCRVPRDTRKQTTNAYLVQALEKCPSTDTKFTYTCDRHTFNYLVDKGFAYLVVADEEFSRAVLFAFLDRIKVDFQVRHPSQRLTQATSTRGVGVQAPSRNQRLKPGSSWSGFKR